MNLYDITCYRLPSGQIRFFGRAMAESPNEAFEKLLEVHPGVKEDIEKGIVVQFHHELIEAGIDKDWYGETPPPEIFARPPRAEGTVGRPRKSNLEFRKGGKKD